MTLKRLECISVAVDCPRFTLQTLSIPYSATPYSATTSLQLSSSANVLPGKREPLK